MNNVNPTRATARGAASGLTRAAVCCALALLFTVFGAEARAGRRSGDGEAVRPRAAEATAADAADETDRRR